MANCILSFVGVDYRHNKHKTQYNHQQHRCDFADFDISAPP